MPSTYAPGGRRDCSYPQSLGLSCQECLPGPQVRWLGDPWCLRPQRRLLVLHDPWRLAKRGGQDGWGRAEAAGIAGWDDDKHAIAGGSRGHRAQKAWETEAPEIIIIVMMVMHLHKTLSVYQQPNYLPAYLPLFTAVPRGCSVKKGSFLQGSKRDVRGQGEARPRLESSLSDPRNHILHLLLLLHGKAL